MGLRLVAHFYDRSEALVVASVLDAAGVPTFVEYYLQLTIDPGYLGALRGFRIVVCEEDLAAALAILAEARATHLEEGEALEIEFDALNGVLSFMLGALCSAPAPIRGRQWRSRSV